MAPEFVVVGNGTLALGCCCLLAERGLRLRAVVSEDEALGQWARRAGVPHLVAPAELATLAWAGPAPVLLSIGNERLIAPRVLERFPRAFNFHDGPLPHYAGSHVTSWALMARERTYAITWHRMTSRADAGDILLQAQVPLGPDDTALTLNAKCHEVALQSFAALAQRLARHDFSGTPQNMARRTFYRRDRRADNAAILDWKRDADDLRAMVRALSFGPYVNRLGLPKLWLGSGYAGVHGLDVCASRSVSVPGTLVGIAPDSLTVATASHDVRLRGFVTLDGRALSASELAGLFALREEDVLPAHEPKHARAATDEACDWKEEAAWIEHLKALKPVAAPLPAPGICGTAAGLRVVLHAPPRHRLGSAFGTADDFAFAVVLAYLARAQAVQEFDVGLRCGHRGSAAGGRDDALLAGTRPLRISLDFDQPFEAFGRRCLAGLAAWRSRKPYLRDAVLRYPGVARPRGWDDFCSWPVTIDLGGAASGLGAYSQAWEIRSGMTFAIGTAAGSVTLIHGGLPPRQLDRLSAQLSALAEDCLARPHLALGKLALLPPADGEALLREMRGVWVEAPAARQRENGR